MDTTGSPAVNIATSGRRVSVADRVQYFNKLSQLRNSSQQPTASGTRNRLAESLGVFRPEGKSNDLQELAIETAPMSPHKDGFASPSILSPVPPGIALQAVTLEIESDSESDNETGHANSATLQSEATEVDGSENIVAQETKPDTNSEYSNELENVGERCLSGNAVFAEEQQEAYNSNIIEQTELDAAPPAHAEPAAAVAVESSELAEESQAAQSSDGLAARANENFSDGYDTSSSAGDESPRGAFTANESTNDSAAEGAFEFAISDAGDVISPSDQQDLDVSTSWQPIVQHDVIATDATPSRRLERSHGSQPQPTLAIAPTASATEPWLSDEESVTNSDQCTSPYAALQKQLAFHTSVIEDNPADIVVDQLVTDDSGVSLFPIQESLREDFVLPRYIVVTPFTIMVMSSHPTRLGRGLLRWERSIASLEGIATQPVAMAGGSLAEQDVMKMGLLLSFRAETPDTSQYLRISRAKCLPVMKYGWLQKKKQGKWKAITWKTRYFRLDPEYLAYFVKESDSEPRGLIKLSGWCEVTIVPENPHQFLIRTGKTHHLFEADSTKHAREWAQAINTNAMFLRATTAASEQIIVQDDETAVQLANAIETARRDTAHRRAHFKVDSPKKVLEAVNAAAPDASVQASTAPLSPMTQPQPHEAQWLYIDDFSREQGPFPESHLRVWVEQGYMNEQTLVRCASGVCRVTGGAFELFLPIGVLFDSLTTAFTGTTDWQSVYNESAAYHSLLESAVQLGHDQQAVLQNVYLMRENRLPPDMGVLLDLMGVTEDEVVKCE